MFTFSHVQDLETLQLVYGIIFCLQKPTAGVFLITSRYQGLHTSRGSLLTMTMSLPSVSGHTARL